MPALEKAGGTVVADNPTSYNKSTDFSSGVSRVLNEKPDVMFIGGASEPTALVVKQARELGFKGGFMLMDQAKMDGMARVLGGMELLVGSIGTLPVAADVRQGTKAFVEHYRKQHGADKDPTSEVSLNYTAVHLVAEAMKLAGTVSDVEKIRARADAAAKSLAAERNPGPLDPGPGNARPAAGKSNPRPRMKSADRSDPTGLVYVNDTVPGFTRRQHGKGFSYRDVSGKPLRDPATLHRIRQLAIPPAYTDVWICPLPNGHLQATGRDARGRKQYRYHADWRQDRDDQKYARLAAFGRALPRIRRRVSRDLAGGAQRVPSRTVVLATMVRLLDTTCIRIGSDRYARSNGSYGLTTLRNRHARIERGSLRLSFAGKGGVRQELALDDPRIARIVRRLQELPGQELFQYRGEDEQLHGVGSSELNDYLEEAAGERFTAKDFRTWHGTVIALEWTRAALGGNGLSRDGVEAGYSVARMLAEVARRLGNTPAVCRKSYIHPDVLGLGARLGSDATACTRLWSSLAERPANCGRLLAAERRLLNFLEQLKPENGPRIRTADGIIRRGPPPAGRARPLRKAMTPEAGPEPAELRP